MGDRAASAATGEYQHTSYTEYITSTNGARTNHNGADSDFKFVPGCTADSVFKLVPGFTLDAGCILHGGSASLGASFIVNDDL
jgi:hypothetical protein